MTRTPQPRRAAVLALIGLIFLLAVPVFINQAAEHPWVELGLTAVHVGFAIFLGLRFGILALAACFFSFWLLQGSPLTYDLSAWYAGSSTAYLAVLVGLTLYGCVVSLGGRPLLPSTLLGGEP